MSRPKLLDLFCGPGGCAMGYHRAGFDVTGVDVKPQPRYPFRFVQGDALNPPVDLAEFDVIHASPPCQHYTAVNRPCKLKGRVYPDLVAPTRKLLQESGKVYVIENVIGAPLENPISLCGSTFGLAVRRHRLFESNVLLLGMPCRHREQEKDGPQYPSCFQSKKALRTKGPHKSAVVQVYGNTPGKKLWPWAMGIDWMTSKELTQAIPPAYTEFIGKQLITLLEPKP